MYKLFSLFYNNNNIMNKQLAKKGVTLNKTMTNTESFKLNDLTVTSHIIIPVLKTTAVPSRPQNPVQGTIYIEKDVTANPVTCQVVMYVDGSWI